MKRKMIATLAVMSICLCSCGKGASTETPKATITSTTENNQSTSTPQATTTPEATSTPEAVTSTPEATQTASKNEMLSLTSKTDLKSFKNVKELTLADSINADFVFHTSTTLKDLTVNSVNYDGETCKTMKKEYEVAAFTKSDAVHIKTYIPDTFSNLLITYKTQDNKVVNKLVSFDMTGDNDTNVVLQDIDAKKIQAK